MQARFLLGPAGSGKTFRCLERIRAALADNPGGPPLILLAPKQATFQLERQLLAPGTVRGFTRLHILSFDRLARFILDELQQPLPEFLDEEGRIMVLRALLSRHRDELVLYRASARLPGFARQLSALFREFQRHHLGCRRLMEIAEVPDESPSFRGKLRDFAMLLQAYQDWLTIHELQDADRLLDVATASLKSDINNPESTRRIDGLWLDGFAEMTPQELELLAAILPRCNHATLAFCLEGVPNSEPSWLSTWSAVGQTFRRCFQRLENLEGCEPVVDVLPRQADKSRFREHSMLAHIEQHWASPRRYEHPPTEDETCTPDSASVRVVACPDSESEAINAAREIRKFVRLVGGRYSDCAVMLRSLDGYEHSLRRAFRRFGIPCFVDRRESAAHHPLAELTRSALRLITFGWDNEDWFGLLKTGLMAGDKADVDWLENEALARGWAGEFWKHQIHIPADEQLAGYAEALRTQWAAPLLHFESNLGSAPVTGSLLGEAFRNLWDELGVAAKLQTWSRETDQFNSPVTVQPVSAHATVWTQMLVWLENVERAFRNDALPLREWLPILDAGLANLTIGVVPPALDQVVIGTIDRSRNPELKFALLLGLNEGVFPARPEPGILLTEAERERLETRGASLGARIRHQIGHERYYGYIACTRAGERLHLSYAKRDSAGQQLNPSPFIAHLLRLFPALEIEQKAAEREWHVVEHVCELAPRLACGTIQIPGLLDNCPAAAELAGRLRLLLYQPGASAMTAGLAELLYSPVLRTSVSRIEQYASCPFRFFINSGLRAEERKLFELDARERGSFQHEALRQFHDELQAEGKRWRDITPGDARERIGKIADELTVSHGDGLMEASDKSVFTARSLKHALQDFIEITVGWMHTGYEFDPTLVEVAFGSIGDPLPAWELDLGEGHRMAFRGKIDRVDIAHDEATGRTWCAIVDYKSSARRMDQTLLTGGVQIQLPAYLAAITKAPGAAGIIGGATLDPAALYYANLRGSNERGINRIDAVANHQTRREAPYKPAGRLNFSALPWLDSNFNRGAKGTQFAYQLTSKRMPKSNDAQLKLADDFLVLLAEVEAVLRSMGERIYRGACGVDPYRKGTKIACEQCDYRAVCRIDPWTHKFRSLQPAIDPRLEEPVGQEPA